MMTPNLPLREMLAALADLMHAHPAEAGGAVAVLMVLFAIAGLSLIAMRARKAEAL